jgi:antitoxin (DNA-binding transcriptional repressor) of toxin-antitoxin stability system
LYIVHMKRVTASEARKNWFRLLDEVAQGAVVCIERGGRRIILRREPEETGGDSVPDYSAILRVPHLDEADRWGWTWSEEDGSLEPEE